MIQATMNTVSGWGSTLLCPLLQIDRRIAAVTGIALGALLFIGWMWKRSSIPNDAALITRCIQANFSKKIASGSLAIPLVINEVLSRKIAWKLDIQGLVVDLENAGIYDRLGHALTKDQAARVLNICQASTWVALRKFAEKQYGLNQNLQGKETTQITLTPENQVIVSTVLDFSEHSKPLKQKINTIIRTVTVSLADLRSEGTPKLTISHNFN